MSDRPRPNHRGAEAQRSAERAIGKGVAPAANYPLDLLRVSLRLCASAVQLWTESYPPVIRCFLDDLHVVHVRLAHAGRGDLDELCALAHLADGGAAGVTHAGAQPTHELMNHCDHAALVGNAPLDAFRAPASPRRPRGRLLEIAIARALLHGAERAHPAIRSCRSVPGTARSRPALPRCRRTSRRASPSRLPPLIALAMSPE